MIVIGNGMIAKEFSNYDFGETCIFASGVATSKKLKKEEYLKELEKLKNIFNTYKNIKLIYFSSLSVLSFDYTEYIKHKLFIEHFIENNFKDYIILRLPIIVGNTENKNQLLPFLYDKIIKNEKLYIKQNTYRDLIDVSDIPKITKFLIDKNHKGKFNISLGNKILVEDIVNYILYINKIFFKNINYVKKTDYHYSHYICSPTINFVEVVDDLNLDPINIIEKYFKK